MYMAYNFVTTVIVEIFTHTQQLTGDKIYRLFADLKENHGGHTFEDYDDVRTSAKMGEKCLLQGRYMPEVWMITCAKAEK
jgi:hypothetical protein